MIRKTLAATQAATYSIDLPNQNLAGMPTPHGTGFFISPAGWFVTAAHVVTENNRSDGKPRNDYAQAWLKKESRTFGSPGGMCVGLSLDFIEPELDFALFKVDFASNAQRIQLIDRTDFSFVTVSSRELSDAEPVYSFGYPLPEANVLLNTPTISVGGVSYGPRVTSAIIASTIENTPMVSTPQDTKVYVLDKALNYGNSGGPIVATETGNVHAFCSRFQPVTIPQDYKDPQGNKGVIPIKIPSLYGVVISLANQKIQEELRKRNILIVDD
jgi:serine protease Do